MNMLIASWSCDSWLKCQGLNYFGAAKLSPTLWSCVVLFLHRLLDTCLWYLNHPLLLARVSHFVYLINIAIFCCLNWFIWCWPSVMLYMGADPSLLSSLQRGWKKWCSCYFSIITCKRILVAVKFWKWRVHIVNFCSSKFLMWKVGV